MKKLRKLFSSDKLLLISGVIAIEFFVFEIILNALAYGAQYSSIFTFVLSLLCVIFTITSYFKHDKNVMKPLMGAVLTLVLVVEAQHLFDFIAETGAISMSLPTLIMVHLLLQVLLVIDLLFIFINHFVINSDHHSSPKKVFANQICLIILMVLFLAQAVISLFVYGQNKPIVFIEHLVSYLAYIPLSITIVCIESKLDVFRVKREKEAKKVSKAKKK